MTSEAPIPAERPSGRSHLTPSSSRRPRRVGDTRQRDNDGLPVLSEQPSLRGMPANVVQWEAHPDVDLPRLGGRPLGIDRDEADRVFEDELEDAGLGNVQS